MMLSQLYSHSLLWLQFLCILSSYACLNRPTPVGNDIDSVKLYVDTEQIVNTVNERFVSVAIDSDEIKKQWDHGKLNFSCPQMQTLSAALNPTYLRLGGTDADFLIFKDANFDNKTKHTNSNKSTNYTMTGAEWDEVNQFCSKVGWQLIFDINVLLRNGTQWDDSNFLKIMAYNADQGYKVHWELGNEPNAFGNGKVTNVTISGEQLAQDYRHLRGLLDASGDYRHNFIMGPSVTNPRVKKKSQTQPSLTYMIDFFQNGGGDAINVSTWHQYYMDGRIATEDNFTDPNILDSLIIEIKTMNELVHKYKPGSKIWLGETSSTYGGGTDGLSNAYAAGFMWLDKLGVAALYGIDVVIRQTLYGGNYSLLDAELDPLPDWWLSLLYKKLVGQKVLEVTASVRGSDVNLRSIRSYAHCTLASSEYTNGDVTVYLLNLDKSSSKSVSISQFEELKSIDQYLLTSHGGSLRSKEVNLNGKKLKMVDERTLPDLPPKQLDPKKDILMPPISFGFYVMKGANASSCV